MARLRTWNNSSGRTQRPIHASASASASTSAFAYASPTCTYLGILPMIRSGRGARMDTQGRIKQAWNGMKLAMTIYAFHWMRGIYPFSALRTCTPTYLY
jgi:hypothetical protein